MEKRELVFDGVYSGGVKHDEEKLRFDLIPPEAEAALASVLTYGAKKYGDRNWEEGMKWNRVYAAVRRHMNAWQQGEACDEESHLPHLHHALTGLAFLVTYDARQIGEKDIAK